MNFSELKQFEEAKRDRMWNPQQRWIAIQRMLAWVEQQRTAGRNTRERCLLEQAKKLARR